MSYDELLSTIDQSHPFLVRIRWNSGGGHAIVCCGYRRSDSSMALIDPWENTSNRYANYNSMVQGITLATGTGRYRFTVRY